MAEIPLRSYLHEIEKHIESGRTDQAISHSRYLLQIYPKYVDAYRLLGKSFLESQRYTDAGDIFQRVLSAIPDDFVSQVGMSIIREDEGNLDEAIWHMERAFEVQPSNNAIQEELGRLYAKRDNIEPPKIRLTRGALARLYYKGELYQQAVSEIRSALAENTNRIDLQALLADIYLKINQRVEAADTALSVLHHLPNCMIAIQVMIQVLAGADREDELKNYRQRLAQLDPYSAFTSPEQPNSEEVQDSAVQVEKLDWRPDQVAADTTTPAWAASLGVDLADLVPSAESTLPDWLDDLAAQPGQAPAGAEETSSAFAFGEIVAETATEAQPEPQPAEDIPDWLREAGWQSPSDKDMTRELSPQAVGSETPALEGLEEGIIEREDQLAAAEIPDWLQALKPEEQAEAAIPTGEPDVPEEELTPWLDKILPAEPAVQIETPDVIEIGPSAETQDEPDWLKAISLGAAGASATAPEDAAEPLGEETLPGAPEPTPLAGMDEPLSAEPLLEGLFEEEFLQEEQPAEEAFLGEPEPIEPAAPEPLPFWLQESEIQADEAPTLQSEMSPGLPDWVIEPAAEDAQPAAAGEDFIFETEAAIPADLPDWLLEEEERVPEAAAVEPELEDITAPESETELPDWLFEPEEQVAEEAAVGPELESVMAPEDKIEMPDWLREAEELVTGETALEPELGSITAPEGQIEAPEWTLDTVFPASAEVSAPSGLKGKDRFEEEAGVEIPSWLQAAKFAAAEEEGASAKPAANLPDWLTERQLESLEGPSTLETEGPSQTYESALPDWLIASEPETSEIEAPEPQSTELPSWLLESEAELPFKESPGEAEPPTPIEAEIELPAWLIEPEEVSPQLELSEEVQDFEVEQVETLEPALSEPGEVVEEPAVSRSEKEEQLEEAFAWLMGLEAQAETPTAPEAPEELVEAEEAPPTTPVDWVTPAEWPETEEPALAEALEEEAGALETPAEAIIIEEATSAEEPTSETPLSTEAAFVEEVSFIEEPVSEASLPGVSEDLIDEDAAFAWLESLAVKQGASEALLLTPEERSETMPEWVRQDALAAEAAREEFTEPEPEPEPLPEQEAQLVISDELIEAPEEAGAPALEPAAAPDADFAAELVAEDEGVGEEALLEAVTEEPVEPVIPAEEAEPALEAVEQAEIEIETEAAPEPEALAAQEEIPELPEWLTEATAAPVEEFDWSPPPFPSRSVDLNQASLSDLERIPGVGFIIAQAILNHREQNGPFQSVDDLALAPEIGPEALAAARDYLFVTPPEPAAPQAEPAPLAAEAEFVPVQPAEEVSSDLEAARLTLAQGGLEEALAQYEALILSNRDLQPVAQDLLQASERFPNDLRLWQALGDAYLRLDQVQEALEAYVKAEQLLH